MASADAVKAPYASIAIDAAPPSSQPPGPPPPDSQHSGSGGPARRSAPASLASATSSSSKVHHRLRASSPSSSSTAALDDWTHFLDALMQELHCPISKYGIPCNDFSSLSCGCVASEQWARSRLPNLQFKVCPNCGSHTELKKPVVPLRHIYNIVMDKRKELGLSVPEEVGSDEEVDEEVDMYRHEPVLPRLSSVRRNSPRVSNISRLRIDDPDGDNDSTHRKSSTLSGQSSNHEVLDGRTSSADRLVSGIAGPPSPKTNLVSLFSAVARQAFNNNNASSSDGKSIRAGDDFDVGTTSSVTSPSSLLSQHSYKASSGFQSVGTEPWNSAPRNDLFPLILSPEDEAREKHYSDNYPIYRKDSRYPTQTSRGFSVIPRGKVFEATAISPDTRKFALISEKRWEVYTIPTSYKLGSGPMLVCVGKSSGEYGATWDTCTRREPDDLTRNTSWTMSMAAMSTKLLAIAGTNAVLRVHDLDRNGMPVFSQVLKDAIRCIAISDDGSLLAAGVMSRDTTSGTDQPTIMLYNLTQLQNGTPAARLKPVLIDLPYRDPVKAISFSTDGKIMGCTTALESRFVVINLYNPNNPRLVIRSSRKVDHSLESEGITSLRFFPGNRLMVVSSVATDAHPILVDILTSIQNDSSYKFTRAYSSGSQMSGSSSIFPLQDDDDDGQFERYGSGYRQHNMQQVSNGGSLLHPKVINRFHEVGAAIHQVAVSPRANSVAFLDRNGTVFLAQFLRPESEHRRVVAVVDVTNANKLNECASVRFSPDGMKLIIVDRKGILYVEDFGARAENGETLKKCRIIK
ncbi:uncharacterized protein V1518DRAFT_2456 [Limtongia smithiae]|uniref:uncharacterized protein n=1 Tax=Limtongia smithiae TaxID=1125753 RepID=UPI0034CE27D5